MLVEVKVRVNKRVGDKLRKTMQTFLLDSEFFANAEYKVTEILSKEGGVEQFEIQSIKLSPIKEIATQFLGECMFKATLKDIWTDDKGNEKYLRYQVILWSKDLLDATSNTQKLVKQGYDMQIESLKEVDYVYVKPEITANGNS